MERFIRYVYEYDKDKRIRNVGFIKVETGCEETIVHMQAKGFHNGDERRLVLYLFYEENGNFVRIFRDKMDLTTPVLSWHHTFSVEDVANYDKICGVLIETESGHRMAATWDDRCVDVSRIYETGYEKKTIETPVEQQIVRKKCTKIFRQDIANLSRCDWKLANNRFLVHGYNNYDHLLFIDDGNHLKLGVPGIYHIEEAKCADTFGFKEFLSASELGLSTESEGNQEELFGYWCRPVRGKRNGKQMT